MMVSLRGFAATLPVESTSAMAWAGSGDPETSVFSAQIGSLAASAATIAPTMHAFMSIPSPRNDTARRPECARSAIRSKAYEPSLKLTDYAALALGHPTIDDCEPAGQRVHDRQ